MYARSLENLKKQKQKARNFFTYFQFWDALNVDTFVHVFPVGHSIPQQDEESPMVQQQPAHEQGENPILCLHIYDI